MPAWSLRSSSPGGAHRLRWVAWPSPRGVRAHLCRRRPLDLATTASLVSAPVPHIGQITTAAWGKCPRRLRRNTETAGRTPGWNAVQPEAPHGCLDAPASPGRAPSPQPAWGRRSWLAPVFRAPCVRAPARRWRRRSRPCLVSLDRVSARPVADAANARGCPAGPGDRHSQLLYRARNSDSCYTACVARLCGPAMTMRRGPAHTTATAALVARAGHEGQLLQSPRAPCRRPTWTRRAHGADGRTHGRR